MIDDKINNKCLNEKFDLQKINKLPEDIVREINGYIPDYYFMLTNKENFADNHYILKQFLLKKNVFETYVREMIRRDNYFVFLYILQENYNKWVNIKNYMDDFVMYTSYIDFLINYCIIHNSNKCCLVLMKHIDSCNSKNSKNSKK